MPDGLDKLFGSPHRVRILKLFLMNPSEVLTHEYIAKTARISGVGARKEIKLLRKIGLLKSGTRETQVIIRKTKRIKKKREPGFTVNNLYPYLRGLKILIVDSFPVSRESLVKKFRDLGRGLKFVALAGVFTGIEGGLDVLVVGDNIRRGKLDRIIGELGAEIGKELNYVLFDTNEFKYRHSMYDKFVLNVLDNEHDVLFDTLKAGA